MANSKNTPKREPRKPRKAAKPVVETLAARRAREADVAKPVAETLNDRAGRASTAQKPVPAPTPAPKPPTSLASLAWVASRQEAKTSIFPNSAPTGDEKETRWVTYVGPNGGHVSTTNTERFAKRLLDSDRKLVEASETHKTNPFSFAPAPAITAAPESPKPFSPPQPSTSAAPQPTQGQSSKAQTPAYKDPFDSFGGSRSAKTWEQTPTKRTVGWGAEAAAKALQMPLVLKWGPFTIFKTTVYGGPFRSAPKTLDGKKVIGVKMAKEITFDHEIGIPTEDFRTPPPFETYVGLSQGLAHILEGSPLYVGCMGGTGRTGVYMALLAKVFGLKIDGVTEKSWSPSQPGKPVEPHTAYLRSVYKPHAVETDDQQAYVAEFPVALLASEFRRAAFRRWVGRFFRA